MKNKKYFPFLVFIINLLVYSFFNYGGIRFPDSEIMYRATESLVVRGELSIPEGIHWNRFGLGKGLDGKDYSLFGPTASIVAAPLLKIAYIVKNNFNYLINKKVIPISFHKNNAGTYFFKGQTPPNLDGHFERFVISFFNILISSIGAVLFYLLLFRITKSNILSLFISLIYSFGSLIFIYTMDFYSEPLCTLFIIASFLFIIKNEENVLDKEKSKNYFFSGLLLGLAITTHITAVLSVPFFFMFILGQESKDKLVIQGFIKFSLNFILGLSIFSLLLLYYNYLRFGNIFETGRTVDPLFRYAWYVNPLRGLYGMTISGGKGIFIYSPIIILGILFWKHFHKKYPHLSIAIIGMIIIRLFFIASRSDWHAGFCLGPRYLVIIIPFLFIPIAIGLKEILKRKQLKRFIYISIFSGLCIIQQVYFAIGELFSFLHILYLKEKAKGIYITINNLIYLDWEYSPVFKILNYKTGPFILRNMEVNNYMAWFVISIIFAIAFSLLGFYTYKNFINSDQITGNT